MSDKPSYLGLLNAIAVGEARGYRLLNTWAETTSDPALQGVLKTVALREQEHAASFAKRICELGFGVLDRDDPDFPKRLEAAGAAHSDRKKFKKVLGYNKHTASSADTEGTDQFARFFDDPTIDIRTGELLGRFIAEERDSGRRLRQAFQNLGEETEPVQGETLDEICSRLDRLAVTIEELKVGRQQT